MKIMDTEKSRINDSIKTKQARLHKIIAKLRLKKEKRIEGPIRVIRVEKPPHPYSIMERSLSLAIRYAMILKMSSAVFCRLIKAKIRQELARRSGDILIL